jgi:hypothetical protein
MRVRVINGGVARARSARYGGPRPLTPDVAQHYQTRLAAAGRLRSSRREPASCAVERRHAVGPAPQTANSLPQITERRHTVGVGAANGEAANGRWGAASRKAAHSGVGLRCSCSASSAKVQREGLGAPSRARGAQARDRDREREALEGKDSLAGACA